MKNKLKQGYVVNNQNPLVLLTNENGVMKDLVGHLVIHSDQKVWVPYKVGDELDFEPFNRCYPKFIAAGYGKFGSIDEELKSQSGLLFLIADGEFPMGCGPTRFTNTIFAVRPKAVSIEEIADQVYRDASIGVEPKASGHLSYLDDALHINGFSESYLKSQQAYLDAVAGLVNSSVASEKTPIIFHVKSKGGKLK